jgi:hypothetical protein
MKKRKGAKSQEPLRELAAFLRKHPWLDVTCHWEKNQSKVAAPGWFTVRISSCDGSGVCYVGYAEAETLGEAMAEAIKEAVSE